MKGINWQLQFLTFESFNATMQISGSDIHLLSVFDSVVRNNGFSAILFHVDAYPSALKKFQHSSGVKRSQIWLCCTNRDGDSLYESSVIGGMHEQLGPYEVQDHELVVLQ